ncbi:MAG TPA: hypothetical protein VFF52_05250, partial [Isosphaeraceae bacterium]|nr:hypothetical protein [Isosphaeraceae bacterium]
MNRSVKNLLRIHRFYQFTEAELFGRFVDYALTDPLEELMTSIPPEYWPRFRDWIDGFLPGLDEIIRLGSGPLSEHEKATIRAISDWLHRHLGQQESNVREAGASLNGPREADRAE